MAATVEYVARELNLSASRKNANYLSDEEKQGSHKESSRFLGLIGMQKRNNKRV